MLQRRLTYHTMRKRDDGEGASILPPLGEEGWRLVTIVPSPASDSLWTAVIILWERVLPDVTASGDEAVRLADVIRSAVPGELTPLESAHRDEPDVTDGSGRRVCCGTLPDGGHAGTCRHSAMRGGAQELARVQEMWQRESARHAGL